MTIKKTAPVMMNYPRKRYCLPRHHRNVLERVSGGLGTILVTGWRRNKVLPWISLPEAEEKTHPQSIVLLFVSTGDTRVCHFPSGPNQDDSEIGEEETGWLLKLTLTIDHQVGWQNISSECEFHAVCLSLFTSCAHMLIYNATLYYHLNNWLGGRPFCVQEGPEHFN